VPWSTLCRADWVRNDPVLTTRGRLLRHYDPVRETMRQRASIREYHCDPTFKACLADVGGSALSGSPDFGKLIAEETEKWGKVIRAANIKPE
jgi:hypothetical protein